MNKVIRLKDSEALQLGLEIKQKKVGYGNPKYSLNKDQVYLLDQIRNTSILDICDTNGVDIRHVKHLWKKTENESLFVKNPLFEGGEVQFVESVKDAFNNVVLKHKSDFKPIKPNKVKTDSKKALKVTTSDDHVGLEPNPNNNGLFNYEYNAKVYSDSYDKIFNSIKKEYNIHGHFDLILLDNLGDEQDGYNGFTTRGGHSLDQNMSNKEVFEACVDTKVTLIRKIVSENITDKIIIRKVVNDNHSGDFGYLVNIAVKKIINLIYDNDLVEVESLNKFLEHRVYGDHCFILTHGKDKKFMNRGLPLHLNDRTINYINDYINFYNIKSKYIHLEKGDLHQIGFNKCNTFDYRNFMSFAPPSSWVQHNFGDCYSGYSIQVIPKHSSEISHTDYFLDYKKK